MHSKDQTLFLTNQELGILLSEACKNNKPIQFTPKGMSMAPVICETDRVTIVPLSENTHISIGDVAAVILPDTGMLALHRIVNKRQGQFLFKGDNLWKADGYCQKSQILGQVQHVKKHRSCSALKIKIQDALFLMEKYKKAIAFLSRNRIWTFFCKLVNKMP